MKRKVVPVVSTAVLAFTLTACSTDDSADETPDVTATTTVEETVPAENEDGPTAEELNENSLTELTVNAVTNAYNEDIIFTDFDEEVSYYEIEFYDPSAEHLVTVHVSGNDLSITEEESGEAPDAEKLDKIDAVNIDIVDAINLVEEEGEELTKEFELDENDGAVVYGFELYNDREFEVSANTGEIMTQN